MADNMVNLTKYDELKTVEEKLAMIYQWVKTDHINLTQFKAMLHTLLFEE